jgi:acyl-CoA synthetase (AMP-forming)/AMP-acid ligase II
MAILRSPYPDVDIPDVSLTEYVVGEAAGRGDKPALVYGATGTVTTYAELADQIARTAAGLAAEGIGPGDAVGLLGPNTPAWAVAFHAVVSVGALVTPINPLLGPAEVATQLATAGAGAVIVADALRSGVVEAGDVRVLALESLPSGSGDARATGVDPARDLAVLPFSSGTTGLSKGVMLTHRNLVANMEQIRAIHRIGEDDVLVGLLPFFHIYGQTVVVNLGLSQGATIVTMPRFEMGAFLDLLEHHHVTRAHVAPPVVLGLAKAPGVEGRELALRVVISGAAPLDADTANRASERLGAPVRQGYGMTEASPVTHFSADEELPALDPGAIGRLVGGTEGRLVDPASGEDTDGGDGEIWIRGPQVMRGYLGDDDATRASLTEDGWLKTGDIARVEDGDIWRIVDRVKELIKYKGYQVPPAELEALLLGHPGVADVAVIPIPHESGGEAPKACVVAAGDDLDPDELMAWVAERVAPYKRIRAVEFVDEIPKSASGKILRRLLRDGAGRQEARAPSAR